MEGVAENSRNCGSNFSSIPNFRQVKVPKPGGNGELIGLHLYRGSRPDFLTDTEAKEFKALGIRTIIDFRSVREYTLADGPKLLDNDYPVYKAKIPAHKFKHDDKLQMKQVKLGKPCDELPESCGRQHALIDFFKLNYVWAVFMRAPWYVQLYSIFHVIVDVILNTGFRNFVRLFARNVLNHSELSAQYIDMIQYSQASICAALKLICEPESVPALINCAHGKDRTGLTCALIQAFFGTPVEQIAKDYSQSQTELESIRPRIYREIVEQFHMSESFLELKEEHMLNTLQFLKKEYGSVENYFEYIGFNSTLQERLRKTLLSE